MSTFPLIDTSIKNTQTENLYKEKILSHFFQNVSDEIQCIMKCDESAFTFQESILPEKVNEIFQMAVSGNNIQYNDSLENDLGDFINLVTYKTNYSIPPEFFTYFNLKNKCFGIIKATASRNGIDVSKHIKDYGLDRSQVFEIAKIVASINGEAVSEHIKNYNLDQAQRFEIAKICAVKNGEAISEAVSKYIKNYDLDQAQRFEIAKICAAEYIDILYYIKNYDLDKAQEFEIAKIGAVKHSKTVHVCIKNFDLDEGQCFEIAKIAGKSVYKNKADLERIKELAKQENTKNSQSEKFIADKNCYYTADVQEKIINNEKVKVLTGALTSHSISENANQTLIKNFDYARRIVQYVKEKVPFSYNYLDGSKIFSDQNNSISDKSLKYETNIIKNNLATLREKIEHSPSIEYDVKQIEKYGVGNCDELSKVGFRYAEKILGISSIKPAMIAGGAHIFLVVGCDKNSNFSDFKNWDPNTVIVDTWLKAFYPKSKLKKNLMDYTGLRHEGSVQYTTVRLFDPQNQRIEGNPWTNKV